MIFSHLNNAYDKIHRKKKSPVDYEQLIIEFHIRLPKADCLLPAASCRNAFEYVLKMFYYKHLHQIFSYSMRYSGELKITVVVYSLQKIIHSTSCIYKNALNGLYTCIT